MNKQSSNHILMVRPACFLFNEETAVSNSFQQAPNLSKKEIEERILSEFDHAVNSLKTEGITVNVIDDTPIPEKPDAIFPNNWASYHSDGTMVLYPMEAANRRLERRTEIIDYIKSKYDVQIIHDISEHENKNHFLEGTGSIVFDHPNKIAYACISSRTDKQLFDNVCDYLHYKAIAFQAFDLNDKAIYHTNVMMCVGSKFAIICLEAIKDSAEKTLLADTLKNSGHEIIPISYTQMLQFAGNMLELNNKAGQSILAMSKSAFTSLKKEQKESLSNYCKLLSIDITTIETIGGGSMRCMIAEIFLNEINSGT